MGGRTPRQRVPVVPFAPYGDKKAPREGLGRGCWRSSLVYLPLVCLACAALEPSVGAERWLVMLGSPALAALTLAALGGYAALALACAATALAYAIDLIGGSSLTQLSIVGPNPAGGHRFYGIGNELEACLVVLILVGTGAALSVPVRLSHLRGTKVAPEARETPGRGPAAFLVVALSFTFVFAYGRYGADVGAAISLPLGAAVAAALLAGRRDLALYAVLLPIPALAPALGRGPGQRRQRPSDQDRARREERRRPARRLRPPHQRDGQQLRPPRADRRPPRRHRRRGAGLAAPRHCSPPGCAASRRCAPPCSAPSPRPSSAPSPTTPARCCSRSAAPICLVFHRLRLGRKRAPGFDPPHPLSWALRANRPSLAIFLELSGRREPARRGARRGAPRAWRRRPCARPRRPARPAEPGAAPRAGGAARAAGLPDPAGPHRGDRRQRRRLQPLRHARGRLRPRP